jgi:UDP-GlcNAc3NAcA epimerase
VKIVSIVGARPQFIKAAAVSRVLRGNIGQELGLSELLVHTGQHYDDNMSAIFFEELDIPEPEIELGIGSGTHGAMTGRMMEAIEGVLMREQPRFVLVYGDTNSTLAGTLAAAKLNLPVAHVEAGLRSFNRRMPEEINRVLADHASTLLFCPTHAAVDNLRAEGIVEGVHLVGDVMYDVSLFYRDRARKKSAALQRLGLSEKRFALATVHRQENTDDARRLASILDGLHRVAQTMPVVLPMHPRTRAAIAREHLEPALAGVRVVEPLGFLDMVALEQAAAIIFTDSGGVQKEAFFYKVPCATLRDETEWVETVELGWNQLAGADAQRIAAAAVRVAEDTSSLPYGDGTASARITGLLANHCGRH